MEIMICHWLAKMMFMKSPVNKKKLELNKKLNKVIAQMKKSNNVIIPIIPPDTTTDLAISKHEDFNKLLLLQNLILKEIRIITQKYENESEEEVHEAISRFAALVIDRFCLIVFSVALILLTSIFLFNNGEFVIADPSPIW